jgi:hypothetical protein
MSDVGFDTLYGERRLKSRGLTIGGDSSEAPSPPLSDAELLAAFETEAARCRLKIPVIKDTLRLTVGQFADLFVEEGCPYSWKR